MLMIPLYLEVKALGLNNSLVGLVVPFLVGGFGIFLMRQAMQSIPDDLVDAARLDGAGEFHIYRTVMLPLVGPALAALAVISVLWRWNDVLWPILVNSERSLYTVTQGLAAAGHDQGIYTGVAMATASMAILPVIIAYIVFQRWIIRGIATTGTRGLVVGVPAAMTDVVIGCDIGTQSCKGLAMDASRHGRGASGRNVSASPIPSRAGPSRTRATGSWPCERVIAALVAAVGRGREWRPSASRARSTASCPWSRDSASIGPALIWMDRRATAEAAELARMFDAAAVHARTGGNIDASHGGPKIAWLRAQERAGLAPVADGYLMPVSFAVARLTGERLIDPSSASTTLLWDLHTADWAADLMDAVGATAGCPGRGATRGVHRGQRAPGCRGQPWAGGRRAGRGGHR